MTRILLLMIAVFVSAGCKDRRYYDDFKSEKLNQKFWRVKLDGRLESSERNYQIKDGVEKLQLKSTGDTKSNKGGGVNFYLMRMKKSKKNRNFLEARLGLKRNDFVTCSTSKTISFTRATLGGFFFKTEEKSRESMAGDLFVVVGVSQSSTDPSDKQRIFALALKCQSPCYFLSEYNPENLPPSQIEYFVSLGTIGLGETVKLGIHWQKHKRQFVFYKNNARAARYRYRLHSVGPPFVREKHIDLAQFVPNCSPTVASAESEAVFSQVKLLRR